LAINNPHKPKPKSKASRKAAKTQRMRKVLLCRTFAALRLRMRRFAFCTEGDSLHEIYQTVSGWSAWSRQGLQ